MPSNANSLTIGTDGSIQFVYADELADMLALGKSEIRRASHVEPVTGGWEADLSPVGGPKLGPFRLRYEALHAEISWLKANGF